MNCPHCGAEACAAQEPDWPLAEFKCGSIVPSETNANLISHGYQSQFCMKAQISQLKAELAQSVRRDDPRLKEVLEALGQHSNSMQVVESKAKLQSIISGK